MNYFWLSFWANIGAVAIACLWYFLNCKKLRFSVFLFIWLNFSFHFTCGSFALCAPNGIFHFLLVAFPHKRKRIMSVRSYERVWTVNSLLLSLLTIIHIWVCYATIEPQNAGRKIGAKMHFPLLFSFFSFYVDSSFKWSIWH